MLPTGKGGVVLNNDNTRTRDFVEKCYRQAKTTVNPIIDWSDSDVWEFIHEYSVPYCKLYDEGFKRLGCIGCPMNTAAAADLEKYPKYRDAYLRAFEKMLIRNRELGKPTTWETPQDVMNWWLRLKGVKK